VTDDGRRSPGRPPLPRDQIVAGALAILDEQGQEALTLRALAQRLESGTATLYRHFDSRADLLAEVVDRIVGEIRVDAELAEMGWQDACTTLATAMFDVLRRHRNAAPLLAQHIPVGPNAMLQREGALALLLSSGFSPGLAVRAYATISRHVLGFAMQLDRGAVAVQEKDEADVAAYVHRLDPEQFPATRAAADAMPVPLEDEFEFGLRLIIAGLEVARAHETGD
jgi:TetR/AcrR family transcriptional regulator, tetracycline repressor protein